MDSWEARRVRLARSGHSCQALAEQRKIPKIVKAAQANETLHCGTSHALLRRREPCRIHVNDDIPRAAERWCGSKRWPRRRRCPC